MLQNLLTKQKEQVSLKNNCPDMCSMHTAPMSELFPIISEVVASGGKFSLVTAGTSMLPLLRNRKDTVILVQKKGRLKKFDLPLYRKQDGSFALHRVVKVCDDSYNMSGDNRVTTEKGIKDEDIVAVAEAIIRKGKRIDLYSSLKYRMYVRFWCSFRPLKFILTRTVGLIRKIHDFS